MGRTRTIACIDNIRKRFPFLLSSTLSYRHFLCTISYACPTFLIKSGLAISIRSLSLVPVFKFVFIFISISGLSLSRFKPSKMIQVCVCFFSLFFLVCVGDFFFNLYILISYQSRFNTKPVVAILKVVRNEGNFLRKFFSYIDLCLSKVFISLLNLFTFCLEFFF